MSFGFRQPILTAVAVVASVTLAIPGSAYADPSDTQEAKTPSQAKASGNVYPALGYAPLPVPQVTRPGRTENVRVGIFNYSRQIPATAWLRFEAHCYNRNSQPVDLLLSPFKVSLAPNIDAIPDPQEIHDRTVTVPKSCRHHGPYCEGRSIDGHFEVSFLDAQDADSAYASTTGPWFIGRPFNRRSRNARDNLSLWTRCRGSNYQAHHTLPVKFEPEFTERGIENIHHPKHLRWWCSKPGVDGNHPSMWRDYNNRWREWLDENPDATREEVLRFRDEVSSLPHYTYECPPDDGGDADRFDDLGGDNVFADDIERLADSGVTLGCNPPENSRFCPTEDVERQEMAAFLVRLLDLPSGSRSFADVDDDDVFADDIAALAEAGITLGCNPPENSRFCPSEVVEREEMAAFLVRALNLPDASGRFEDVDADNVFADDISALAEAGITLGCNPPENNRFCPTEDVERQQMAAFLVRSMD